MSEKAKIFKVESTTEKGKFYFVRQMPDGEIRCSCPGYVFNNKCKHAALIAKKLGSDFGEKSTPNSSSSEPSSNQ